MQTLECTICIPRWDTVYNLYVCLLTPGCFLQLRSISIIRSEGSSSLLGTLKYFNYNTTKMTKNNG